MRNFRPQFMPTLALNETYRPQYHFTPPEKWLNDPNGMVYYDGEYHLFFQYNPYDTIWGPMHWGHAVSTNLVNWQHLPIALTPDELGAIYSGSAVIDWKNTAGFGKETMIALYTYHNDNAQQSQAIAYSHDRGRTWTKYKGNPVIPTPPNVQNFRDPKVMWYEESNGGGHWVMALAAGGAILFFTSPNLKDWEPSGSFGFGFGSTSGFWETPDLFELQVDGGPETRWVLAVGSGNNAPAGGGGLQYFVGDFNGHVFTSENPKDFVLWGDYGADFYAGQSWNETPDGRRIWLGWMSNWQYAQTLPTSTWRGSMTIPRDLRLTRTDEGVRLVQTAVSELTQLRDIQYTWENLTLTNETRPLSMAKGETLEIIAEIDVPTEAYNLGIRVRVGKEEATTIGYLSKSDTLFVDRTHAGRADFNEQFAAIHTAPLTLPNGVLKLHIFVDRSSVEVFANDGIVTFSERIFPGNQSVGIELFAEETAVTFRRINIYELNAAKFTLSTTAGSAKMAKKTACSKT